MDPAEKTPSARERSKALEQETAKAKKADGMAKLRASFQTGADSAKSAAASSAKALQKLAKALQKYCVAKEQLRTLAEERRAPEQLHLKM